jgi:uncharacterized protein YecT (DUF1311 family)
MKALHKKIVVDIKKLGSSAGPQAIASLRASQNAFERFKAAQCQWIASATMGGTGAGDFQLACTIDLMRGRIQQLKNNWPI